MPKQPVQPCDNTEDIELNVSQQDLSVFANFGVRFNDLGYCGGTMNIVKQEPPSPSQNVGQGLPPSGVPSPSQFNVNLKAEPSRLIDGEIAREVKPSPHTTQNLKSFITNKRKIYGQPEIKLEPSEPPVYQLTPAEEEKREKRREQNRRAADRCRIRKKTKQEQAEQTKKYLEDKNNRLRQGNAVLLKAFQTLARLFKLQMENCTCSMYKDAAIQQYQSIVMTAESARKALEEPHSAPVGATVESQICKKPRSAPSGMPRQNWSAPFSYPAEVMPRQQNWKKEVPNGPGQSHVTMPSSATIVSQQMICMESTGLPAGGIQATDDFSVAVATGQQQMQQQQQQQIFQTSSGDISMTPCYGLPQTSHGSSSASSALPPPTESNAVPDAFCVAVVTGQQPQQQQQRQQQQQQQQQQQTLHVSENGDISMASGYGLPQTSHELSPSSSALTPQTPFGRSANAAQHLTTVQPTVSLTSFPSMDFELAKSDEVPTEVKWQPMINDVSLSVPTTTQPEVSVSQKDCDVLQSAVNSIFGNTAPTEWQQEMGNRFQTQINDMPSMSCDTTNNAVYNISSTNSTGTDFPGSGGEKMPLNKFIDLVDPSDLSPSLYACVPPNEVQPQPIPQRQPGHQTRAGFTNTSTSARQAMGTVTGNFNATSGSISTPFAKGRFTESDASRANHGFRRPTMDGMTGTHPPRAGPISPQLGTDPISPKQAALSPHGETLSSLNSLSIYSPEGSTDFMFS